MSIHKLTAGDGYQYLVQQVARLDATHGSTDLGAYYMEKGETPGIWVGRGLRGLGQVSPEHAVRAGEQVTAAQMRALFGEGRHPNADAIEKATIREVLATPSGATRGPTAGRNMTAGQAAKAALTASRLGQRFPQFGQDDTFQQACAEAYAQYNSEVGVPANASVPADARARIRTSVATRLFTEEHGRSPVGGELNRWIAQAMKARNAVAGYDLTFSPVKSVSALWALADPATARTVAAAHEVAVKDTLRWIEDAVAHTREGAQGVRHTEVQGLIAAAFTHRDARSGDPDLHTHLAISNKVQAEDGRWLALDGTVLYRAVVAASERYNTRVESYLRKALGVQFSPRAQADLRKQPVREIDGIPAELLSVWSARRAQIDAERATLTREFEATHGRLPTPVEAIRLAQQANLATRAAKHEPRAEVDQRAQWRTEAADALGGEEHIAAVLHAALTPTQEQVSRIGRSRARRDLESVATRLAQGHPLDQEALSLVAANVVRNVQIKRARWQMWDLRAEAERAARDLAVAHDAVPEFVENVLTGCVGHGLITRITPEPDVFEPAELCRSDGTSVYEQPGGVLYTSPAILSAEQRIVAAAQQLGGRALDDMAVSLALLEASANGLTLNLAQAQMVRDLATSGRRVQLVIAPAGSGKTTAMSVLSAAWTAQGGTLVGLAPTAVAAAGLQREIGGVGDTLAALTWEGRETLMGGGGALPSWADNVDENTLIVIDEAGMAATEDLDAAISWALSKGASVRLVGDDQQLSSIAAGGVLRDVAAVSPVSTLSELVRFSDPAEGAAGLAMREGDPLCLGFYLDHGRIHVGSPSTLRDDVYTAWAADRDAGVNAVMLAPTREDTFALNTRAQADRMRLAPSPTGPGVALADGARGHVGDTIVTRANDRRLRATATDFTKNGDRWTIEQIHPDGSLTARHLVHRHTVTLPADYVGRDTELGYASTIHGAQGITADACHVVVSGAETRQLLYVAMTRGRHANHVYVQAGVDADLHDLTRPAAIATTTDLEVLETILSRDGSQQSAMSAARDAADPRVRLAGLAARWRDAIPALAAQRAGTTVRTDLVDVAEQLHPGLTEYPAWATLSERVLLTAVATGTTPGDVLTQAYRERLIAPDVDDVAAVIAARVTGPDAPGPVPWLSAAPVALRTNPDWDAYLTQLHAAVQDAAAAVRATAAAWTLQSAPSWAVDLLDAPAELRAEVALWRSTWGVLEDDRRLLGPRLPGRVGAHQRRLNAAIATALPALGSQRAVWDAVAAQLHPALTSDPSWPRLVDQIDALSRAGLDARTLMERALTQGPELPLELPAAALWWRISREVTPAALGTAASSIRPAWSPTVVDLLGAGRAERVMTDRSWPALAAAVHRAEVLGWTPAAILGAAYERTHPELAPEEGGVAGSSLATALTWHVTTLSTRDLDRAHEPAWEPTDADEPIWFDEHGPDVPVDPYAEWEPPTLDDYSWLTPDDAALEAGLPDLDEFGVEPTLPAAIAALHAAAMDRELVDTLQPVTRAQAHVAAAPAAITDLNEAALTYWRSQLDQSWAGPYLADRLPGVTLTDAGYAGDTWTGLVDHLRSRGATDTDLLDAGLARTSSRGTLIDAFRDRLILPIRDADGALRGFTGRANPDRADAGPKYINTATTQAYDKARDLYGRDRLTPDAIPVLVEGPLDAEAVTAAGGGRYVGLAPLGTALTQTHVDQLAAALPAGRPLIVATDPDQAGQKAADRAHTLLEGIDVPARAVDLPPDIDPADYLRQHGPQALAARLDDSDDLAHAVISHRLAALPERSLSIEERVWAMRRLTPVIATLPPAQWQPTAEDLATRLDLSPETVYTQTARDATDYAYTVRARRAHQARTVTSRAQGQGKPVTDPRTLQATKALREVLERQERATEALKNAVDQRVANTARTRPPEQPRRGPEGPTR